MTQSLLLYISTDFDDSDVDALRTVIAKLGAESQWTVEQPTMVDETDSSGRTRPEDQPIRTVGVALLVRARGETPPTPVSEVERLLKALAAFSAERGLDLEAQIDDTYVGEICSGEIDELLRAGLLARW